MASQNDRLRYEFEHEQFPGLFYYDPLGVMEDLESGEGDYLAFLWEKVLEMQDVPGDSQEQLTVLTEEDFHVQIGKKNGRKYCIIQMPKAIAALQCSHIGLVLSQDETYKNYYTVERMESGEYVLCGWTSNDSSLCHSNYMKFAKKEEKLVKEMVRKMVSSQ